MGDGGNGIPDTVRWKSCTAHGLGIGSTGTCSAIPGIVGITVKGTYPCCSVPYPVLADGLARRGRLRIDRNGSFTEVLDARTCLIDIVRVTTDIVRLYGMESIERSVLALYLKRSGSCSIRDSKRFGECLCLVVCECGDSISAVGHKIAGNRVRLGSEYLIHEYIPCSGTLSCSIGVSSEIRHIPGGVGSVQIDPGSGYGFLDGCLVFVSEHSDLVSDNVNDSLFIVHIVCYGSGSIGLVYETGKYIAVGRDLEGIPGFQVPHQLGFFLCAVYSVGISGCVFRVERYLIGIDDPGDSVSDISLVGEYGSTRRYFYGVLRKRIEPCPDLKNGEPLLDGLYVGYPDRIPGRALVS